MLVGVFDSVVIFLPDSPPRASCINNVDVASQGFIVVSVLWYEKAMFRTTSLYELSPNGNLNDLHKKRKVTTATTNYYQLNIKHRKLSRSLLYSDNLTLWESLYTIPYKHSVAVRDRVRCTEYAILPE